MRAIPDDHPAALLVVLLPEPETKELDVGVGDVPNLRLFLVYLQKELSFDEWFDALKRAVGGLLTAAEDHHVVGVPDESVSSRLKLMIELVQKNIGQNRADGTTLRCSYLPLLRLAVLADGRTKHPVN